MITVETGTGVGQDEHALASARTMLLAMLVNGGDVLGEDLPVFAAHVAGVPESCGHMALAQALDKGEIGVDEMGFRYLDTANANLHDEAYAEQIATTSGGWLTDEDVVQLVSRRAVIREEALKASQELDLDILRRLKAPQWVGR